MSARRPSHRFTTGVIVGAAFYAIAYSAGTGLLWAALAGLAGTAIAIALT